MIAIVDYRAGNLTSVRYAFEALGVETVVTSDPKTIDAAERVVFPGVGAAKSAMENLAGLKLVDVVKRSACEKPFLGICLGMQILFDRTEEDGGVECLGVLPAEVKRFPVQTRFKVPEIGWNDVETKDGREFYYFVHSYYVEMNPYATGVTEYAGVRFASMVRKGRLLACQFHPEKSGRAGLELLKGWVEEC